MINWRNVDPALLDRTFRADVEELLQASPWSWTALRGFATWAEQQALWLAFEAGGPRAAPPGKSAHNYGLALDVALDGDTTLPGLQADWDTTHPGWLWLFDAVWDHPRLHSGRTFNDADHIERLGWKQFIPAAPAA